VTKPMLMRLLVTVAIATGVHGPHGFNGAQAQTRCDSNCCDSECCGPNCRPGPPPKIGPPILHHTDPGPIYTITGIIGSIFIVGILTKLFPPPPLASPPPPPSSYPPNGVAPTQLQLPKVTQGGGPGGTNPTAQNQTQALRSTCNLPPAGETRFADIIADVRGLSTQAVNDIAAANAMTPTAFANIGILGQSLVVLRSNIGASSSDMIRSICSRVTGAQPNYLYTLAQDQQEPVNSAQYAPEKLNLRDAHRLASGNKVLVAIIDSGVDASHPDLAGAITASFESAADDERPHSHGTGMAGAIAAHRTMLGTAPRVGLLTVRAFSSTANSAEGTTFNILKGLDWAAEQGARVVNMSFAGPPDPRLREALAKANKRGMVLIAAAGNAGPNSPPLYPGADPSVIAVTATDSRDAIFPGANRGNYIAVAAPGVDVFAPAPDGTYQLTTGTSVAAAEVSGIAALLIERNPALTPAAVRKILMDTAKHLGPKAGRDPNFGAGLVNALDAVRAAKPNIGQ
jgi:subtilisin family serine protease